MSGVLSRWIYNLLHNMLKTERQGLRGDGLACARAGHDPAHFTNTLTMANADDLQVHQTKAPMQGNCSIRVPGVGAIL